MYEVEVKFLVADPAEFERRLKDFGVDLGPAVEEIDQFYQHPSRDFGQTDEGLRIRRRILSDGSQEKFLTYKGPKIDQVTKTRREIEVPLDAGQPWDEILKALSFSSFAVVSKRRRRGHLKRDGRAFDVLLDELPGLLQRNRPGHFVEIETLSEESDVDAARQAVLDLATAFGLSDPIRTSYLGLLTGGGE